MKTHRILVAALLSLVPVVLLAAGNAPAGGPREHGLFESMDTNGDGVVTKEETQAAANARIDKTFAELDVNHDGQITQDEVQAVHEKRRAEMQAKFDARFKQADTNGDGLLSREEVQAGMPRLTRGFDRLDTNKDGELSLDEVKAGREAMAHHMRGGWRNRTPEATPQSNTGA